MDAEGGDLGGPDLLVGVDDDVRRMVDDVEAEAVEVGRLPQLLGDAQFVPAVARRHRGIDLQPLARPGGHEHPLRTLQPQRRPPEEVGGEHEALSIPLFRPA